MCFSVHDIANMRCFSGNLQTSKHNVELPPVHSTTGIKASTSPLKSPLKINIHKKITLTFLHLSYLSPSANGNIFYPTGIVKLNSLVPATMLKSLETECHRCQVLYYHSSIKQIWPYLDKGSDKNNFKVHNCKQQNFMWLQYAQNKDIATNKYE